MYSTAFMPLGAVPTKRALSAAIEGRWSNGAKRSLRDPAPGRYHRVRAPPGTGVPEILDSSLAVPTDVLRGRDLVESLLSELPEHADDAKPAAK